MPNPISSTFSNASLSVAGSRLNLDIRNSAAVGHQDMLFTLNDGTRIPFRLNPQQFEEIEQPIETEMPTTSGWFTFRWQVAPTMYHFQAYCGLAGSDMDQLVDSLVGQIDIQWNFPYLKQRGSRRVKILTVQRIRNSAAPFGIIYDITMRTNNPLIRITRGTIIQPRITSSFLSPTVYVPPDSVSVTRGYIAVNANSWHSITDAATAACQLVYNVPIPFQVVYMTDNNQLSTYTDWDLNNPPGPLDVFGKPVFQLAYANRATN